MHPSDIQAALKKAGTTQKAIAEHCEVSEAMVSRVIRDASRSLPVASRIAFVVRKPVNALWPGRYVRAGALATTRQ